jgi:hypothetical protein
MRIGPLSRTGLPTRSSLGGRLLLLPLLAATLGVGPCDPPFARLTDVTFDDRPATTPSDLGQVEVVRKGAALETRDLMAIEVGDTIRTGASARAVLDVGGNYQVFLDEGTELVVLNPRVLLRRGKAFVRRVLEEVREVLEVNTEYVVAAPTGTAFLVEVPDEESARFIVAEGMLRVSPRDTVHAEGRPRWVPVTYGPREGGVVEGRAPPRPTPALTPEAMERELGWVRRTEAVTTTLVPMLRGTSLDEARALLAGARLEVGAVTERVQEGGRGGIVLAQQLPEGERVRPGTTIALDVSVAGARVPDLIGVAESVATVRLREAGLTPGETRRERVSGARPGRVLRTDPPRGTLVQAGTPVGLVVSDQCVVPDLTGLERAAAETRIREAVLQVGRVRTAGGESPPWIVVRGSQDPAPGSRVDCGATVAFAVMGVIGEGAGPVVRR